MIKQTKGAIKFLIAQYRAVLKKALLASLAFTFPAIAMQTIENTGLHDNSENTVIFEEYGQTVIDDDVTLTTPTNDNYYNYFALDYSLEPVTYTIKSLTIKRTDFPETLQEDYPRRVGLYVRSDAVIKSDITVENGTGLNLNNNSKIVGNVTVNGFKNLANIDEGPGGKLFMHATDYVLDESGQNVTGQKPAAATATIEGNIINNNGSVDVSSDDETYSRASTTLNLTGDYTQTNGVSSVSSDFADATATFYVKGNYTANGGGIWIGISKAENDRHLEEGRNVSLGDYNSVLNIGKDLKVTGNNGFFQIMETGVVNVSGNATIDSQASASMLDSMSKDIAEEDGITGLKNGNLISGKFNIDGNLTVGGQGITVYGEKGKLTVKGNVNTSKENSIYVMKGGTFTGTKEAMLNADENAKNSNIAGDTFNVDATSEVHVTGVQTVTNETVQSIRSDLFATDSGILSFDGAKYIDAPEEENVSFDDAKTFEGTNALEGKEVTNVPDNITGSHKWGNATLASGKNSLTLGNGAGIILDKPKGNNFVNTASGETGSVALVEGSEISLKGTGAVKDVTGSGSLIVDSNNNKASSVTAENVDVTSIKMDNNSSLEAKSLTAENLNLKNSSVSANEIEIKKSANLENSSLTANNNLTVNSGSTLCIVKSSLNLNNLTLKGKLLLDPSYLYAENGIDLSNGGSLAILKDSVVGNGITASDYDKSSSGANLYIGSQLALGNTSDVYLNGNLENSQVNSNTNYTDITGNSTSDVYIDSNSTLYIDSSVAEKGAAITGAETFTVSDDGTAKIVISGTVKAQNYIITNTDSANVKVGNSSTSLANVTKVANFLYKAVESDKNGTVKLEYDGTKAAALSGISNSFKEGILNQAKASGFDSNQNNGLGLLQQMFEKIGTGSSAEISKFRDEANSVTGFIFGGVPLLNELVAQIAHDNVEQHNGFTTTGANHTAVKGTNATVWAMPFYKHSKSDSFKIEGSTYGLKAKIYGLSMGTDFEVADGFRLGFDGIVGHAKTDSKGSLDPSEDDASFWGLGTYGSYNYENLKVMADIGYTAMNTDTDLHTSYGTLTAKNTKSYTFTTGVNAKYNFALTYADVAPHVGIRYNHANIDKYKVKRQGDVMLTGDSISQNYFQFPIGVEVSKQFACGEWNLKPMFDLTATINTGDKKLDAKTTLTGFDNTYGNVSTNAEVLDPVSVRGSLGLEAKYGSLGMGVGYSYTGSKNVKDHVFAAGVNYTF